MVRHLPTFAGSQIGRGAEGCWHLGSEEALAEFREVRRAPVCLRGRVEESKMRRNFPAKG